MNREERKEKAKRERAYRNIVQSLGIDRQPRTERKSIFDFVLKNFS